MVLGITKAFTFQIHFDKYDNAEVKLDVFAF